LVDRKPFVRVRLEHAFDDHLRVDGDPVPAFAVERDVALLVLSEKT
jgi:hypothetical protein